MPSVDKPSVSTCTSTTLVIDTGFGDPGLGDPGFVHRSLRVGSDAPQIRNQEHAVLEVPPGTTIGSCELVVPTVMNHSLTTLTQGSVTDPCIELWGRFVAKTVFVGSDESRAVGETNINVNGSIQPNNQSPSFATRCRALNRLRARGEDAWRTWLRPQRGRGRTNHTVPRQGVVRVSGEI